MKILTGNDFKLVPWKNGQGFTYEILRINDPINSENFILRFSRAKITQDGPFSHFPGIDRILVLLKGNGVTLESKSNNIELKSKYAFHTFPGEEEIHCRLINNECEDFNIMIKRGKPNTVFRIMTLNENTQEKFMAGETYLYLAEGEISFNSDKVNADSLISTEGDSLTIKCIKRSVIFYFSLS